MSVRRQARRILKLCALKPQLRRLFVHHLHKSRPFPVPVMIGQRFGRVVSGAEQCGVYEFPDRDVFALLQIYAAPLDSDRLFGYGHHVVQAARLRRDKRCHKLGRTGHGPGGVGVLFIEHHAGGGFHYDRALRRYLRSLCIVGPGIRRGADRRSG